MSLINLEISETYFRIAFSQYVITVTGKRRVKERKYAIYGSNNPLKFT